MVNLKTFLWYLTIGPITLVQAHPGHDVQTEARERAAVLKNKRGLGHCADTFSARGFELKNAVRRDLAVQQIRREKASTGAPNLVDRDLASLNTTHHSSLDVNFQTDPEVLFASNATCILGPDVTQGPYYVSGELIRENVIEDQPGVPLYLDIQLIDSSTCEPVPSSFVEIWHCNSTGVYSGVVANGNGNYDDSTNINKTFLRGIQQTDKDGIIKFQTIFPGHYTGRTTHIHVLSHALNDTVRLPNDTVSGLYTSHASHVGQIFFDQDLITKVESTIPYSSNTQNLTENSDDSILLEEADDIDPFVEYVYINDDEVADGVFGWIALAIDTSEDSSITPAAYLTSSGGISNPNSGSGGGGGQPPSGTTSSLSTASST
ncbi:hypothetical protein PISL3812_09495 [Talaromyces islandicus]|uniref:Intradiol ring-cleavage dioxygenases domain-containing protein n=1 Tax=Talaromyces islandicus TaxID=28573 RepID=A0A0U1MBW5_TALIS|nr:hypothetical protein PISL3812_09495 [Talaromyces islandicus]